MHAHAITFGKSRGDAGVCPDGGTSLSRRLPFGAGGGGWPTCMSERSSWRGCDGGAKERESELGWGATSGRPGPELNGASAMGAGGKGGG
jgi:hypothetical protein